MAKKEKKKEEPPVDGGDGEGGEAPKKKGLPIMLIAIAGGAVLLLGGGGAAGYFFFLAPKPAADAAHGAEAGKDGHGEEKKKEKKKEEKGGGHGGGGEAKVDPKTQPVLSEGPDGTIYLTLPDTIANIQSADGRSSYLKLKLTFECADEETADLVKENLPRVNDILQGFIRELRPEDLKGSAGNHQLRLEILRRINLVLAPHKVNAVLIEQMLIT
ncbi:flagellar basal body protein FliL [Asticcacaulis sp. AC460]|uniref:flagellar basal body-associated FliL family protein n=1 Tax=Asticcacaulis sp. AC460 TaxID=1282360 RepID=UPI0003C3B247|nr:flagellar basal body-associated FliL family protein [Asticcacaulis sp. AC460]ESQ87285.1 flagellar basal body protein FliL [Asticcacaulis sp. AC460]